MLVNKAPTVTTIFLYFFTNQYFTGHFYLFLNVYFDFSLSPRKTVYNSYPTKPEYQKFDDRVNFSQFYEAASR